MRRKIKIGLFISLLALLTAGLIWVFRPQLAPLDMDSSVTVEAKSIITQMFILEYKITCVPGTTVDVLAEVMADSPDYHPSSTEHDMIARAYGKQVLNHAGLLTSKKSYYLSHGLAASTETSAEARLLPVPTVTPSYYCQPGYTEPQNLSYKEISQGPDGRIVVLYNYTGTDFEAILRRTEGQLKITSIKLVKWYGNG